MHLALSASGVFADAALLVPHEDGSPAECCHAVVEGYDIQLQVVLEPTVYMHIVHNLT